MLDDKLKDDFIKTLNKIATHKHRFDVFKDFVILSAISLHNAIRFNQTLEDEYLTIIKSYSKYEANSMASLLGVLTNMLEAKPFDALGQIYMALEFGDVRKGQFFTPPHICDLMTDLVYGEKIKSDDFITLSEPAVGGGGMVLAFANRLIKDGYNPDQKMWVEAIDLDRTSALMCYIQLSLWNIPARVIAGNALTLEMKESFFTPAHYLFGWNTKLKKRMDNDAGGVKSDEMVASCDDTTYSSEVNASSEKYDKPKKSKNDVDSTTLKSKKGVASGQQTIFGLS